jgi:hypothetical protein
VIGLKGHDAASGLVVVPDPLIIGRDRPAPAFWRLDPAGRKAAQAVEIHFDEESPFIRASASGHADSLITLGPMRQPILLGRFRYAVRLLGADGSKIAESPAAVDIRETGAISGKAYLIAAAVGVVLLAFNYLERKPLTRSYEHEDQDSHEHQDRD